jgi:ubiquinone/menaquinone biosynthesis C-methylase UbiE
MVGVDISKTFVRIANENAQKASTHIAFGERDAANPPLRSDGFDLAVCTAALKNFTRQLDALNETYRMRRRRPTSRSTGAATHTRFK